MSATITGQAVPAYEIVDTAGPTRPWLVLVHGASQHRGLFSAQRAWFAGAYRLLLIDLPGHGGSAGIGGPYGQAEYADGVRAALDHAGVARAFYWGTHTGAAVGLLLALGCPQRIAALVLEGAVVPGMAMPYVDATIAGARERARARGIVAAQRAWFDHAEWFDVIRQNPERCRAEEHRRIIAAFGGGPWLDTATPARVEPIVDRLGAIAAPVLLMNGEHDLADFVRAADLLEAHLPHAERAVVAGGGGFPLWEFPDAVNPRVERFLRQCEGL